MFNLTPGLIFIIGGIFSIFLKGPKQTICMGLIPIFAFFHLFNLNPTHFFKFNFVMTELNILNVNNLNIMFGCIFIIVFLIFFIYQLVFKKYIKSTSNVLIYVGSAISIIFSEDFVSV